MRPDHRDSKRSVVIGFQMQPTMCMASRGLANIVLVISCSMAGVCIET